jgi:6-pyruvoyltetrahydropterin/6-carboxytetrahydropterin synthase
MSQISSVEMPMPAERYTVRVSKDYLVFCAGHFITYDGDHCERLHGHNYRVAVEFDGELDANKYVFDFIALKDHTRAITDTLDHRMLLPTESDLIRVEERDGAVHVSYGDRRWMFPREDCVLLPLANTTAELLARYIGQRLMEVLRREKDYGPTAMRVEVEESFGQVATYCWKCE